MASEPNSDARVITHRPWVRALLAVGSVLIALLVLVPILRHKDEGETVKIVDSRAAIAALLVERNATGEVPFTGGLVHEPLDRETAAIFYPAAGFPSYRWDPHCYFTLRPDLSLRVGFAEHPAGGWTSVTNDHGLLNGNDVREPAPELRILVTGDSHSTGLCAPEESFTSRLESELAGELGAANVEALNASVGAYDPYNYLGVLETYAALQPDVFVVVVYGGNDFYGLLKLQRYFHRRPPAASGPYSRDPLLENYKRGVVGQELSQVVHFLNNPGDESIAAETLNAITDEMARRCAARGVRLVCVYLPPPSRGQPTRHSAQFTEALASIGAPADALAISDRMAAVWLAHLGGEGIAALDLRPAFAEASEDMYWATDYHLNVAGHALVGTLLAARLRGL